ncbi:fibronectin type III domain-containing protein [Paenibacillus sp. FA6]|uniref:fibronectin type III domain-containing protein n=1 Tax=Paenibacillus sp. FA6 TaxID=3413029 RepID=UPI003F65C89D
MRKLFMGRVKGFRRALPLMIILVVFVGLLPSMASAADRGAWAPNVSYAVNDTVTYGGNTYKDIQAHTSLIGWEPPIVPALWQLVPGGGGSDTQAPSAPSNLQATGTTTSSITLAWNASSDNVGVTGYDVYRGSTLVGNVLGSTLSYTNTGLNANTTYMYQVKAKDAAGNVSAYSNQVSATTDVVIGVDTQAPTVPTNVTVSEITTSSVSLSWTASTDNVGVTGYNVYKGTTLAQVVTGTTVTVTGLAVSTPYSFTIVATDAVGNVSPASVAVTATTHTAGSGQLPKHILTGYWHNFINGSSNLKVSDIPSQYDIIVLSFADMDLTKPGGVTFNIDSSLSAALGGYTNANLISDIQAKRAQGKKVILSIGGEMGNVNLGSASPNVSNFVTSMSGLITQYGLDGIDIDLESGMNVANLTSAVRQVQQQFGSGFILTMAPQTIDMQYQTSSYIQLYNNLKDITTVVNVQYYNSGCMLGRDGQCYSQGTINFLTALSDLTLQWIAPSQLGLGVPAVSSAAGGGYIAPSVVNNALNCLATGSGCGSYKPVAKYPDIRGAMTWSINWDKTSNYNFANTVKPILVTLP